MKCSQCGAIVEDGLRFCKKCGAKVKVNEIDGEEQKDLGEFEEQAQQQGIQLLMRPTQAQRRMQTEDSSIQRLKRSTTPTEAMSKKVAEAITKNLTAVGEQKQIENKDMSFLNINKEKANLNRLKEGIKDKKIDLQIDEFKIFFKFMRDLIKNPLMDKEEIDKRLDTKNTFIYMAILLALNTLMSVVLMEFILRGLKDFIDVVAYLMSNLNTDIHYLRGQVGLSFVIGSLVMNIGHIVIFTLLMSVIGSKVMKQNINWQDVCKYMLVPLGVLTIGKLPVLFVTILSVKLGIVLYLILICMMMIMSMTSLNKGYEKDGSSLYSMMGFYLLSLSINAFVGIKIIMMF